MRGITVRNSCLSTIKMEVVATRDRRVRLSSLRVGDRCRVTSRVVGRGRLTRFRRIILRRGEVRGSMELRVERGVKVVSFIDFICLVWLYSICGGVRS